MEHRKTRPYSPQTNGKVERSNGRVRREMPSITVGGHRDLEHLLLGYNRAYDRRRQRVLHGRPPEDVVRRRLREKPDLADPHHEPPERTIIPNALLAVGGAKNLMQPDSKIVWRPSELLAEPRRSRSP